jgi:hypothetical protein
VHEPGKPLRHGAFRKPVDEQSEKRSHTIAVRNAPSAFSTHSTLTVRNAGPAIFTPPLDLTAHMILNNQNQCFCAANIKYWLTEYVCLSFEKPSAIPSVYAR